ncbi:MAG: Spy/CpxP family protein refolding chaperone [bacterium]|jgi:Spy/CpxP family protein refolding chaperone
MNNRKYRSRYCFRKIILGLLVVVMIPLTLAGCRKKEMSPRRATELATDRLGLSDEQSQKIAPIAEDLFAEKESLQEIRQTINAEILSQMNSETADAEKLEALLTGSFEQLRAKLPKFANSFAKFHATLTTEQRAKIVEKMEKRRKRSEKGDWGRHRVGLWH